MAFKILQMHQESVALVPNIVIVDLVINPAADAPAWVSSWLDLFRLKQRETVQSRTPEASSCLGWKVTY